MVIQTNKKSQLRRLVKKREILRQELKQHFSQSAEGRNYRKFELVVDELDELRKKMQLLRRTPLC